MYDHHHMCQAPMYSAMNSHSRRYSSLKLHTDIEVAIFIILATPTH